MSFKKSFKRPLRASRVIRGIPFYCQVSRACMNFDQWFKRNQKMYQITSYQKRGSKKFFFNLRQSVGIPRPLGCTIFFSLLWKFSAVFEQVVLLGSVISFRYTSSHVYKDEHLHSFFKLLNLHKYLCDLLTIRLGLSCK